MIALYVDDCLCIGDKEALKGLEDELNEADLKTTVENKWNDYLSCEIKMDEEKNVGVLRQRHLIKSQKVRFGKVVIQAKPKKSDEPKDITRERYVNGSKMKKKRKGYTKKANFTKNMKWTKNISKKDEVTFVLKE